MAQEHSDTRSVTVSGEGVVRVEPDQAVVRFGIVTRADSAEEARRQNAEAAAEAMNAVRELGIDESQMRLETLRLQPAREWDEEARRWREMGLEATRQVVVEVRDLDLLPTLVAEIVQRGANRLEGISYELRDREQARNDALLEAVTNAREKAALLAEAVGESVGQVLTIHEQSFDFPRPMMRMETYAVAADKAMAAPEPDAFAAGEIEVRATVQVVFSLE